MGFFDDVKKSVSSAAKTVAQKSSEVVETTKLNMTISQEKEKIEKIYSEVGKAVVEEYKMGNDKGFAEKCEEVKAIEAQIAELQQKVLELKNASKCPGCGAEITTDVAFCPKCGTKLN